jgi:hypothetical protein
MRHPIALWAALAALFGNLVAIAAVDFISSTEWLKLSGAVLASIFVGAAVYARERLTEEKKRKGGE